MDYHPYIDLFFPTPLEDFRALKLYSNIYKVWTVNDVPEAAPQEATPVSAVVFCKIVQVIFVEVEESHPLFQI